MNFSRLREYLGSLDQREGIPALDCKVMREHQSIFRFMKGHSDYASSVPVTDQDLYEIYSCTKVITATAVMQLVEQGKISLADELSDYLPEFDEMQIANDFVFGEWPIRWPDANSPLIPARNKIHIHQLLTMTAGLSYDVTSVQITRKKVETANQAGTREMMKAIASMPLISEPGSHYSYALGHDVLAAVIEVVTSMTFGEYLNKYIFDPLGMQEVYFHIPEGEKHRITAAYAKDLETGSISPHSGNLFKLTDNYESGGAGLVCTVDSYSLILDALANGGIGLTGERILKPETIHLMTRNRLTDSQLVDFRRRGKVGYGYGLGVRTLIDRTSSRSPLGEFGWEGAAGAYAMIDPINHISIFYAQELLGMLNAFNVIHPTIRDLVYEALDL